MHICEMNFSLLASYWQIKALLMLAPSAHHKINTSLLMLKECPYTASSRDALENTPPRPSRFPSGGHFAPLGPWEISWDSGSVFSNTSLLSAVFGYNIKALPIWRPLIRGDSYWTGNHKSDKAHTRGGPLKYFNSQNPSASSYGDLFTLRMVMKDLCSKLLYSVQRLWGPYKFMVNLLMVASLPCISHFHFSSL